MRRPRLKPGPIITEWNGSFQIPSRWVYSRKYQALTPSDTKAFLNFLCMVHLQGGAARSMKEVRVGLGMWPKPFQRFLERMIRLEMIRETDDGYVPYDYQYFEVYVPHDQKERRKARALYNKFQADLAADPAPEADPIFLKRANWVLRYLNKAAGTRYAAVDLQGRPSLVIQTIAHQLAAGQYTVAGIKGKIGQIAQTCTSEAQRLQLLKPSVLFTIPDPSPFLAKLPKK